jgi:hypothetical protein
MIVAKAAQEEVKKPSLLITREEGCEPPKKLEYKPGQPIEELCTISNMKVSGATHLR